MGIDFILFYVILVIFFASIIRSAFGFGESLIAVPLLALYIPLEVAVPLSVLHSITIAAVIVVQDKEKIHFESAGWLVLFSLIGIPLGLLLLVYGNEQLVKVSLGVLIIAFSVYSLLGKKSLILIADKKSWLFGCGFLAGVFGGAYGLNGPPLVVYGSMRRWSPQYFRGTLQGYFLPASILGMLGYWMEGLWTSSVTRYYLWTLPAVLLAIFLGRMINSRMKSNSFLKYVFAGLVFIGLLLLLQSAGILSHS